MKIRRARIDDMYDIFLWRNNVTTRNMSIDGNCVDMAEHEIWYKKSLIRRSKLLLIGLVKGNKIGICRFDLDSKKHACEVSINLNPKLTKLINLIY